jgi:hypothetical protein
VYSPCHDEPPARSKPANRADRDLLRRDRAVETERAAMTLFWCAVALLQVVFLPGYLVFR